MIDLYKGQTNQLLGSVTDAEALSGLVCTVSAVAVLPMVPPASISGWVTV